MEIIKIENLNHIYSKGTPFEKKALDSINIKINKGENLELELWEYEAVVFEIKENE